MYEQPTRAERVKAAMRTINRRHQQPSPGRVQKELGERVTHNLNGRDSQVYAHLMGQFGYIRVSSPGGRVTWRPGPARRKPVLVEKT